MTILVTGGLGYIGSHTVVELIESGRECVIIDNLSNSSKDVLFRIEKIVNKKVPFVKMDLLNKTQLYEVFRMYDVEAVIHFAGFKSVSESIRNPLKYYNNNIGSVMNLLEVMQVNNKKKLVFSSSATVYGNLNDSPLKEGMALQTINPYGKTKLMGEEILRDTAQSDSEWSISLMRYFNPIGAHPSGFLGETSKLLPNNLMPHILKVALGEEPRLKIYGGDYDTFDGSCIRDFIHIMDLANGHVKALEYVDNNYGCEAFNLGTGKGYSVLELIQEFSKENNIKVPFEIVSRREGDIAISVADVTKAEKYLGWTAKRDIKTMCKDSWRWHKKFNELKNNKELSSTLKI